MISSPSTNSAPHSPASHVSPASQAMMLANVAPPHLPRGERDRAGLRLRPLAARVSPEGAGLPGTSEHGDGAGIIDVEAVQAGEDGGQVLAPLGAHEPQQPPGRLVGGAH